MSLTQTQQIYEALKKSRSALVTFKAEHNGDIIASSLALALIMKKINKNIEIAGHGFYLPDNFKFLPGAPHIKNRLTNLRKFIISLNIAKTKIQNFHYQVQGDKLQISIEPTNGNFSPDDLSADHSNFKHDLIITLNTPDLESLSNIYEDNTDFFYQTPIINIDHSPDNEHYGHYNLVDVTAASVAEIIHDLFREIDANLFDEEIATCLLTGMIVKTNSFKTPPVTPKSLNIAGSLVAMGARREQIIKNIFHTKSIATLKLWGNVLLKLQLDEQKKIAWSEISLADFNNTETTADDLPQLIDEIITNIPTIELTALFYQTPAGHFCLVKAENKLNLNERLRDYRATGSQQLVKFEIKDQLPSDIIKNLKNLISG